MRAVTNLMKWMSCDYAPGKPAVLHMFPEMVCWEGSHSLYAALAMGALMAYLMASNVRPHHRLNTDRSSVLTHVSYLCVTVTNVVGWCFLPGIQSLL
jgi:hypothetical protein